jgi:hypothetical protein
MENDSTSNRPNLEVKELTLKVRELELKVKDLELPAYKKLSFWTSLLTVLIAVIGIAGQSILSSIKNEKAELKTEQAAKELTLSLARKDSADIAIGNARKDLDALEKKRHSLQKELDSLSEAYNSITTEIAFSDSSKMTGTQESLKTIITEANSKVSNILLKNSSDDLLQSSVLKIYYLGLFESKALAINKTLASRSVKTNYSLPPYSISYVKANEIVYYNKPQLNYCLAVQSLLKQSGYGDFRIRLSSGANATISYFKIYLVN